MGAVALRGPAAHSQEKLTQVPPPPTQELWKKSGAVRTKKSEW